MEIVPMAEGAKTLTIKLDADQHLKFHELARKLEASPNGLAQVVIDLFMEDYEKDAATREWPPVAERLIGR